MTEAKPKADLVKLLRATYPSAVVIRHEDRWTSGIPDISFTLDQHTTWIEVKLADPDFESKGIQELTMLRLARVTTAFYVVYYSWRGQQRTYIVEPAQIKNWKACACVSGFDHAYVVQRLRRAA